jgi:hypothetical protein
MMRRALVTAATRQMSRRVSMGVKTNAPLHPAAGALPRRCFFSDLTTPPTGPSSTAPAHTSKDGVVGMPIDFDLNSKVEGNESQIVTVTLEPGQVLRAESGAMMYMTNGVEMNTTAG